MRMSLAAEDRLVRGRVIAMHAAAAEECKERAQVLLMDDDDSEERFATIAFLLDTAVMHIKAGRRHEDA